MPTFDLRCDNPECSEFERLREVLLRHWDATDPDCSTCGKRLRRLPPAPAGVVH